jgi:hypothetical protein
MSDRIALIAGAGRFPLHVAQAAKRHGMGVVAMGIQGWADPALSAHVEAYEELAVGQLGRLIERLKFHGVRRAIMAGKVTKDVWLTQRATFDAELLALVSRVPDASVTSLLGAIGQRLAREGITLLDSSTFLKADLCPAGVISARQPSEREQRDIRLGAQAARTMAALDVGQTVVVKEGVIVAVEALEGTDAAIRRAHALAGAGLVVVKMASPAQDRRFDLPVVGPETLATLREAGVSCLAVEAGTTLLLEREAVVASANASAICLMGIAAP